MTVLDLQPAKMQITNRKIIELRPLQRIIGVEVYSVLKQQSGIACRKIMNCKILQALVKEILSQLKLLKQPQNMLQSGTLATMLALINHQHFSHLIEAPKPYENYIFSIDRYLTQRCNMRIQHKQKQALCQSHSMAHLLALVLFLLFKSSLVQQQMRAIEQRDESIQSSIIFLLKSIEAYIQDLQTINDLKSKARRIQAENDYLDLTISQSIEQAEVLKQDLNMLVRQNTTKAKQQKYLKEEKRQTFEKLGITYETEYSSILNDCYEEQRFLIKQHRKVEALIQEHSEVQAVLKERINENAVEISHLYEEKEFWEQKKSTKSTFKLSGSTNIKILQKSLTQYDIQAYHRNNYDKIHEKSKIMRPKFLDQDESCFLMLRAAQDKIKKLSLERSYWKESNRQLESHIKKKQSQISEAMRQHASISTAHRMSKTSGRAERDLS